MEISQFIVINHANIQTHTHTYKDTGRQTIEQSFGQTEIGRADWYLQRTVGNACKQKQPKTAQQKKSAS